ncbi:hypothetical protein GCM10023321_08600 [Pseudonocardia eucalypti]|uniref:NADH:quinone oxidoreductase/Mrp antiporter transmembrane domain-containing protein n=1 Tax=Pseudonocardia eucalypti TaxID=648755 RepID=A0ABP9PN22_9PSEU|nr:multicomponent Na+:H+ antiporter subunit D [Pseudonocardia eucalypti]
MAFPSGALPLGVLPAAGIALPMLTACLLVGLGRWLPRVAVDALATGAALAVLAAMAALANGTGTVTSVSWIGGWLPDAGGGVGIALVADRFGAGLAALAAGLVAAALLYSWHYLRDAQAHFQALLLLFLSGMVGFALSGDLFDMLVYFELMGAVAYGLAGYKVDEPRSVQGGLTFGVINSVGAYFALAGVALLYAATGQLGLAQLGEAIRASPPSHGLVLAGFVLVGSGWLVKAAVVPFHFWLADAHAVAPTPVCVVFSGVMAELGLYGVARVYLVVCRPVLPEAAVHRALVVLAVVTALLGSAMCLVQRHLKRLLAYSTIAHIGLFLLALQTFTPDGGTAAALYLVGHAGVKGALFLLVGLLLARYRSVDEAALHGAGRPHRLEAALFLLAALALAGLPPGGPGLGKALAEDATARAGIGWAHWVFLGVSVATGAAVLRAGARVYLGIGSPPVTDGEHTSGRDEEPETEHRLGRPPVTMLGVAVLLLAGGLSVGVLTPLGDAVGAGADRFLDGAGYRASVLHGTPPPAAVPSASGWTAHGGRQGLLAGVLAVLTALAMVYRARLTAAVARPLAVTRRVLTPVRAAWLAVERAHSGHIGDYLAWLLFGVAAFAALLVLPG